MKKYKIHICAFIFSIIILMFGNIIVDLYENGNIERNKSDIVSEGNKVAALIDSHINSALLISQTLSYIIAQDENMNNVESVAKSLVESYKESYIIEILPKGIIKSVYPNTPENQVSLNKNIYTEEGFSKEIGKLKKTGDIYISNLIQTFSGKKGIVSRGAVYIKKDGKDSLWGYVNCIVQESEIKKIISETLSDNYNYELYYNDINTNEKISIASNVNGEIKNSENIDISFLGNNWFLSVDKEAGSGIYLLGFLRLFVIVIAVFAYITLYRLMIYPFVLREKREREEKIREILEYDKIKTEFFANMSHELRTPLNVILGSIQLINLNLKKDVDIREVVEKNNKIIKQNCYRLLRIISNIIDITKLDSNYLYLQLKTLNLVSVVEDITLSIVDYAKSKNVDVEFDTDVEEAYIKCDPDKIERIILNLLSNSIKFTRENDKIFVNIYDFENKIRICVKDTGIGIPEENLENVFERFKQVNKSFIREHEGSGIGLSLVKSLVEMHGGEIWVESESGKGSEFYIELPKNYFKLDAEDECAATLLTEEKSDLVEKINIEFSDIYFN